ncbi:MAG: hypothetical protein ACQEXX_01085 [Bacillota bacterium]
MLMEIKIANRSDEQKELLIMETPDDSEMNEGIHVRARSQAISCKPSSISTHQIEFSKEGDALVGVVHHSLSLESDIGRLKHLQIKENKSATITIGSNNQILIK